MSESLSSGTSTRQSACLFNGLRSFAILSVVCAHTALVPEAFGNSSKAIARILHGIGVFGVPIFFILSGYFFYLTSHDFRSFLKKRVASILVPWLCCQSVLWLYVVLRKGDINLLSWAKFMIGVHHSTYYLSILMLFYVSFFFFRKNMVFLLIVSSLSLASIVMTTRDLNFMSQIFITPYLNPFNWAFYFATGIVISKMNLMSILVRLGRSTMWVSLSIVMAVLSYSLLAEKALTYWSYLTVPAVAAAILFSLGVLGVLIQGERGGDRLRNKALSGLSYIGKCSFSIYLIHELFAGAIVYFTSKYDVMILVAIRPAVVMALSLGVIQVHRMLFAFLQLERLGGILIGSRADFPAAVGHKLVSVSDH